MNILSLLLLWSGIGLLAAVADAFRLIKFSSHLKPQRLVLFWLFCGPVLWIILLCATIIVLFFPSEDEYK